MHRNGAAHRRTVRRRLFRYASCLVGDTADPSGGKRSSGGTQHRSCHDRSHPPRRLLPASGEPGPEGDDSLQFCCCPRQGERLFYRHRRHGERVQPRWKERHVLRRRLRHYRGHHGERTAPGGHRGSPHPGAGGQNDVLSHRLPGAVGAGGLRGPAGYGQDLHRRCLHQLLGRRLCGPGFCHGHYGGRRDGAVQPQGHHYLERGSRYGGPGLHLGHCPPK